MLIEHEIRHSLSVAHAKIARANLGHLHHLTPELALIKDRPEILLNALSRNADLVGRALYPTPAERAIIEMVSNFMGDSPFKSADNLLRLVSGYEPKIHELAATAVDPGTEVYKKGIGDLTARMTAGWTLKINGDSPHDNEPDPNKRKAYDYAIWGHVNGTTVPNLNIEFWAAHQIERTVTAGLIGTPLGWTSEHKDWLLNIATWRAIADGIKGVGIPREVYDLWKAKRPHGLGWANQKREEAYRKKFEVLSLLYPNRSFPHE